MQHYTTAELKGMTTSQLLTRMNELAAEMEANQERALEGIREFSQQIGEVLAECRGDIRTAEMVCLNESIAIEREYSGDYVLWIGQTGMDISAKTYKRLRALVVG